MSPRVEGNDLLGVEPRRLRRKVERRVGVGVVGLVVGIEGVESDGEGFVDGVGSRVGSEKGGTNERNGQNEEERIGGGDGRRPWLNDSPDSVPNLERRRMPGSDDGTSRSSIGSSPLERNRLDSNLTRVGCFKRKKKRKAKQEASRSARARSFEQTSITTLTSQNNPLRVHVPNGLLSIRNPGAGLSNDGRDGRERSGSSVDVSIGGFGRAEGEKRRRTEVCGRSDGKEDGGRGGVGGYNEGGEESERKGGGGGGGGGGGELRRVCGEERKSSIIPPSFFSCRSREKRTRLTIDNGVILLLGELVDL